MNKTEIMEHLVGFKKMPLFIMAWSAWMQKITGEMQCSVGNT